MTKPNIIEFERLVRAYLAGEVPWDSVHKYALEMELANAVDFPLQVREPLEELHLAFLTADANDDPQFRADNAEISKLLNDLDRAQAGRGST